MKFIQNYRYIENFEYVIIKVHDNMNIKDQITREYLVFWLNEQKNFNEKHAQNFSIIVKISKTVNMW